MVPIDVQLELQHLPLSQQLRIIPLLKSLNVKHFLPVVGVPASDSSQMGIVAKVTASITSASSALPSRDRGFFLSG